MLLSAVREAGHAYLAGPDASGTRYVRDMAEALTRAVRALALPFRLEPVANDAPYGDAQAMMADIRAGRLLVSTLHCAHPAWDPWTNVLSRAVHDFDHASSGADFSCGGELEAYRASASRWPQLAPLLYSEVVLQRCAFEITGAFQPQKVVVCHGV